MQARWGPGVVVGEYRLLERLGQGGMGAVDLALHLPTGARRAVKSIPASADAAMVLRFQREAEALARVDRHPGVVRVHALGTAHDRHYLVMDHLPGGDLEQRLARGSLPPAEAVRLGVALARALAHVHAQGVLHRDLKPSNVLFDERGAPVLVDFGLARALDARTLTMTGEVLGTPSYMAPEQALGDLAAIGPATDVYGLGAILYRALGGHPPVEGRSTLDVLSRVIEGARPRLRERAPAVPPALERVVERALARAPADRFGTAEALARALEDAQREGDRRRPRATLRAGVGLVLALGLGVVTVAATARSAWEPPRDTATDRAAAVASHVSLPEPGPVADAPVAGDGRPLTVEEIGPVPGTLPEKATAILQLSEFSSPLAGIGYLLQEARVEEDYDLVARMLAAVALDPDGQDRGQAWALLSRLFLAGSGVARSEAEGRRCLEEAAKLEHMGATRLLGKAYAEGQLGVELDLRRGLELLAQVAGRSPDEPGFNADERNRGALDLAWLVQMNPGVLRDDDALTLLAPVGGPEATIVRAALRARRGDRDPAIARDLEVALLDPGWGANALSELIAFHRGTGHPDLAEAVLADVQRRADEGDLPRAHVLGLFLADQPEQAARAASLLVRVLDSNEAGRKQSAGLALLSICRREAGQRRPPPMPVEEAEERVRRLPDGEALLRGAR